MLGNHGRSLTKTIFTPLARLLAKLGVSANAVTIIGTIASVGVACATIPFGYVWQGGIALGLVLFADSVDGTLARMTTGGSRFGAFLDSTLDRISDGAVFASVCAWLIFGWEPSTARTVGLVGGLIAIVGTGAVPYARARAESIGVLAQVGIAERTDRLIVVLVGAALTDWGCGQWWAVAGLIWVAFASLFTVGQRIAFTAGALKKIDGHI